MFHVKQGDALIHAKADRETVLAWLKADHELTGKLDTYVELLAEWQDRLNLIGAATLAQVWQRHILDSAQLYAHFPRACGTIMDMGSGAGFPGLVLAMMAGKTLKQPVLLIESDGRKCRFLEAVIEATSAPARVIHDRFERLAPMKPHIITARAVAPMEKLLALTKAQHHPGLICFFMKGRTVDQELTKVKNCRSIGISLLPSITHADGVIVKCGGFTSTEKLRERSA